MPRGTRAKEGDVSIAQNGYSYTHTKEGRRLTHHIIAEEKLGRPLASNERVSFADGDRTNFDPSNILVTIKQAASIASRLAKVNRKIHELQQERSQLLALQKELKNQEAKTK